MALAAMGGYVALSAGGGPPESDAGAALAHARAEGQGHAPDSESARVEPAGEGTRKADDAATHRKAAPAKGEQQVDLMQPKTEAASPQAAVPHDTTTGAVASTAETTETVSDPKPASPEEPGASTEENSVAEASPPVVTKAPAVRRQPATGSAEAASRLFAAGKKQLDEGRARAALVRFKKAVMRSPKSPEAWFGLALARTDLRQGALARAAAERVLKLDSSHPGATLLLGFLAQQKKDVDTSRKLYARYLELEPEGPFAAEVKSVIAQLP
ncbi:MAG: tetratricopeptide repeat protein [Myxococcota bacterium]